MEWERVGLGRLGWASPPALVAAGKTLKGVPSMSPLRAGVAACDCFTLPSIRCRCHVPRPAPETYSASHQGMLSPEPGPRHSGSVPSLRSI